MDSEQAPVFTFGPPRDNTRELADGMVLPEREWLVYLNGRAIGEVEVHLHRRRGRDGKLDVSFGLTAVVYGPAPGGR